MSEPSLRVVLKRSVFTARRKATKGRGRRRQYLLWTLFLLPVWEQSFPWLPTMQCQEGERPQAVPREILHREQAEGLSRLGMVGGRNAILVPEVLGADITKTDEQEAQGHPLPESPPRCTEGIEAQGRHLSQRAHRGAPKALRHRAASPPEPSEVHRRH